MIMKDPTIPQIRFTLPCEIFNVRKLTKGAIIISFVAQNEI